MNSYKETLLETKTKLERILQYSPGIIYTRKLYGDYGVTFVSDNVLRLLGYEPEAFLNDSSFWISHILPEDRPRYLLRLSHILEQRYQVYEYRFLHKDGAIGGYTTSHNWCATMPAHHWKSSVI